MNKFEPLLSGGDLRSIGYSNTLVSEIRKQRDFDELFKLLFHSDRVIVMRAADLIEKITIHDTLYLAGHKKEIIGLCDTATNKELKWHLAQLLPRLNLNQHEFSKAWSILTDWATDKTNSRMVRVNSIQSLSELVSYHEDREQEFDLILQEVENENIPSINARIRKIRY